MPDAPDEHDSAHPTPDLPTLLARVPEGWTRIVLDDGAWGLSRVARPGGRSTTLTAEHLGTGDGFGANIWHTSQGDVLKPCEVPAERVLDLLNRLPIQPNPPNPAPHPSA